MKEHLRKWELIMSRSNFHEIALKKWEFMLFGSNMFAKQHLRSLELIMFGSSFAGNIDETVFLYYT